MPSPTPAPIPGEKQIPVINMEDFEVVDMNDKLNLLMSAINKINTTFHLKFEELTQTFQRDVTGVAARVTALETTTEELMARVDDMESNTAPENVIIRLNSLEAENAQLRDELTIVKGLVQVQDKQIVTNKNKIVDLTARSMAKNIVISGIEGDDGEETVKDCKDKVIELLKNKMQMDIDGADIEVAHRMGAKVGKKPWQIVARCSHKLRSTVFSYTKNLKDVTNDSGDKYYVNAQLPEPMATEKRERDQQYRSIMKANSLIPEENKQKRVPVQIKNNVLYINKKPQKTHIFPPNVQAIFNIDKDTQKKLDNMTIVHSDVITEKGSNFRGHAIKVRTSGDIRAAYKKLRLLYPESDHIMLGYTVGAYTGHQDNAEYGAGKVILQAVLGWWAWQYCGICDQGIRWNSSRT